MNVQSENGTDYWSKVFSTIGDVAAFNAPGGNMTAADNFITIGNEPEESSTAPAMSAIAQDDQSDPASATQDPASVMCFTFISVCCLRVNLTRCDTHLPTLTSGHQHFELRLLGPSPGNNPKTCRNPRC